MLGVRSTAEIRAQPHLLFYLKNTLANKYVYLFILCEAACLGGGCLWWFIAKVKTQFVGIDPF